MIKAQVQEFINYYYTPDYQKSFYLYLSSAKICQELGNTRCRVIFHVGPCGEHCEL